MSLSDESPYNYDPNNELSVLQGTNPSEDKQAAVPGGAGTHIIPEFNLCSLDHRYWR